MYALENFSFDICCVDIFVSHINSSVSSISKLSNILAKVLLGVPINDYTNGFRFYSKRAAKTIISKCNKTGGGFIILSEIISGYRFFNSMNLWFNSSHV